MENNNNTQIKLEVMEGRVADEVVACARSNPCPRCNAPQLTPVGEMTFGLSRVWILICLECEFGSYLKHSPVPVQAFDAIADDFVHGWQQRTSQADSTDENLKAQFLTAIEPIVATLAHLGEIAKALEESSEQVLRLLAGEKAADKRIEELEKLSESQVDTLAHFGETLEAIQGGEEFGDLVLRLLKERDRSRRAILFAMCTIRSGEDMTPEAEKIFTEALGSYSPLTFTVSCLGLLTDVPDELVVGARVLARALDKPVYLTRAVPLGAIPSADGDWVITIDRDEHGSEVRIDPDGSAHEMDTYT